MISLVVIACLAAQPETCAPTVVLWSDQARVLSCAAPDPAPLAAWAAAHPDMIVKDHWCLPSRASVSGPKGIGAAMVLPLEACDVTTRARAIIWSSRNPGKPAVEECRRLSSN